jgi:starch synthase (maltosyl-transferring)
MLGRLVIDQVRPRTLTGAYPAKAAVGDHVPVSAWIHRDGHDLLAAWVLWRPAADSAAGAAPAPKRRRKPTGPAAVLGAADPAWQAAPLQELGNDEWAGWFAPTTTGLHEFVVVAWTDHFATWRRELELRATAGDDLAVEFLAGAEILEWLRPGVSGAANVRAVDEAIAGLRRSGCTDQVKLAVAHDPAVAAALVGVPNPWDGSVSPSCPLWVDRPLARCSAWYEFFPRSEGGLAGARKRLGPVADMGFDVVYLPPIHPIGTTARKGRGGAVTAAPGDVGSPWAIGSPDGGHTAIDPNLGTFADFDAFVAEAAARGLEVALDYALQCSPDHPWVREHPEWFHHRPDGTIRYAENPPKKYQDIYPINFWPADARGRPDDAARSALWAACRDILLHWIGHGVRVFRVDNPHTKPVAFWEWLLASIKADHPDVLFLAEAFTRPKVMAKLGEIGFTWSYTYFTWRSTRRELEAYLVEVSTAPSADELRPHFWPNTPDILAGVLRGGNRAAFMLRFVLAAFGAPNYGIYSGYELCENEPASEQNEEYARSEKYELRHRPWDRPDSLTPFITRVNDIRRRHPACADLRSLRIHDSDNEALVVFSRTDPAGGDPLVVVVNLDPDRPQEATLSLDLGALGLPWDADVHAFDELSGQTFTWHGPRPYVRLDPAETVAHVLALRPAGG